ncbi:hypothetical protein UY3_05355 [Chelonia mydas]|uniref:Myb/SANT-like DNA-binding domain-containing protein n=1 Tax=Chelonia mydas TaxID=8469 RepID=M7BHS5_CHEMY|nr:hypothetical protein UY3_05355 [Chelonia mydas]
MQKKGHKRDMQQCCDKIKEPRQVYQKARETNCSSGAALKTCHFYQELHAILSGNPTSTTKSPLDASGRTGGSDQRSQPWGQSGGQGSGVGGGCGTCNRVIRWPGEPSQDLFLTLEESSQSEHSDCGMPDAGKGISGQTHHVLGSRCAVCLLRESEKEICDPSQRYWIFSACGEAVQVQLQTSRRNFDIYEQIAQEMQDKEYDRDQQRCCVKAKELRQAYQKAREANNRSGAKSETCSFYKEQQAIACGDLIPTPHTTMDSPEEPESQAPAMNTEEEDSPKSKSKKRKKEKRNKKKRKKENKLKKKKEKKKKREKSGPVQLSKVHMLVSVS